MSDCEYEVNCLIEEDSSTFGHGYDVEGEECVIDEDSSSLEYADEVEEEEPNMDLFVENWGRLLDLHIIHYNRGHGSIVGFLDALHDKVLELENSKDLDECVLSIYPIFDYPVDVSMDRHAYLQGMVKVARALDTLPWLEALRLELVPSEEKLENELDIPAASRILKHVTSKKIRCLSIGCSEDADISYVIPNEHIRDLAAAIVQKVSMQKVSIHLRILSDPTNVLQKSLLQLPHLTEFEFFASCCESLFWDPSFCRSLVWKDSMRALHLKGVSISVDQAFAFCKGLEDLKSKLEVLSFDDCHLSEDFVEMFDQAMSTNSSLSSIVIRPAVGTSSNTSAQIGNELFTKLATCCYSSSCSLREFALSLPLEHSLSVMDNIIALSLQWQMEWKKYNKGPTPDARPYLRVNFGSMSTTQRQSEGRFLSSDGHSLDAFRMVHFVFSSSSTGRSTYGNDERFGELQQCDTFLVPSSILYAYTNVIEGILLMNDVGRRYIWEDPFNRRRGVEVLAAAAAVGAMASLSSSSSSTLDCLYIHLRENPFLLDKRFASTSDEDLLRLSAKKIWQNKCKLCNSK